MNVELQQQLMDFVYGLLDESEADALCARITSDPEVARAYSKVKLQCDSIGRAARIEAPTVAWIRPEEVEKPNATTQAASTDWSTKPYRRIANWCLGMAASGLICLVGSSFWMPATSDLAETTPVAMVAPTSVQVVLTGPSELHAEVSNPFTVQVANEAGTPVSTTLDYRVYDDTGAVSWGDTTATDEFGNAHFAIDASVARKASRLEVIPASEGVAPVLRELDATPDRFATYLRMDRPLYQPGERVFYRSVTLSQYGLRAEQEVATSFEIVNSDNEPIEGSTHTVETDQGVGRGEFALPDDLPDGSYTLIARSPQNRFREEWRDFQVRRYEAPKIDKQLELAKDSYTLGEQVDVDFFAKGVAGKPLADVSLQVEATLDGASLDTPEAKTDAAGNSRFALQLPDSIDRGKASVSVTLRDGEGPAETITKDIPINLGKVNVDFYPEGGYLVAGLPSRVYFYGRDPLGEPTHVEGTVVDSSGKEVTSVVTQHEGRGVFSLTPAAHEQYRLMIEKPAGVTKEVPLPLASMDHFATIATGQGVFDDTAPIDITFNQRTPPKPLIVAAYCRGAMVGQQTVEAESPVDGSTQFTTTRETIALDDNAQGVIRVTVFDPARSPPEPVAERLVYRRVRQKLDVQLTPDTSTFTPGQDVQLDLSVSDENNTPIPATLGISIVDDSVLNLADDKSVRMPTYFHLLEELDSPEQLEDANFYLSDEPESTVALDSLLGTQGWRRFRRATGRQFIGGGGFGGGGGAIDPLFGQSAVPSRYRPTPWTDDVAVPVAIATTFPVQTAVTERSGRVAKSRASGHARSASVIIVASIILLGLVVVASTRRFQGNRLLKVFAGTVAVVSLLVTTLSLPRSAPLSDRMFNNSAPTAGAVSATSDKVESDVADSDYVGAPEEQSAGEAEGDAFKADALAPPLDPPAAAPMPGKPASQLKDASVADDHLADEEKNAIPEVESEMDDTAKSLPMRRDKKSAVPSPDSPPQSELPEQSNAPAPAAKAMSARGLAAAPETPAIADGIETRQLKREYASWFYEQRMSVSASEQSSSTIFWHPLFVADDSGRATVYFKLPKHASSFRAIVEAHGSDRLGAGELLINSREP